MKNLKKLLLLLNGAYATSQSKYGFLGTHFSLISWKGRYSSATTIKQNVSCNEKI